MALLSDGESVEAKHERLQSLIYAKLRNHIVSAKTDLQTGEIVAKVKVREGRIFCVNVLADFPQY